MTGLQACTTMDSSHLGFLSRNQNPDLVWWLLGYLTRSLHLVVLSSKDFKLLSCSLSEWALTSRHQHFLLFNKDKCLSLSYIQCQGTVKIALKWRYFEDRCSHLPGRHTFLSCWRRHILFRKRTSVIKILWVRLTKYWPSGPSDQSESFNFYVGRILPASSSCLDCSMAGTLVAFWRLLEDEARYKVSSWFVYIWVNLLSYSSLPLWEKHHVGFKTCGIGWCAGWLPKL